MADEFSVDVCCGTCGIVYAAHPRTARAQRASGRSPQCEFCRVARQVKVDPAAREWASATLAAMSDLDRRLVEFAFRLDER